MEQAQEQPKEKKSPIKELLDKLAWQRESEALYDAFIDSLNLIGDRDIKSDCCLNTVKYMATQNASARAKDPNDDVEVAALFEEECQRFSADLLKMPGQFREWLASRDGQGRKEAKPGINVAIIDIAIGASGITCNCPRCRQHRSAVDEELKKADASETPTEVPPPPPPAGEEAAP